MSIIILQYLQRNTAWFPFDVNDVSQWKSLPNFYPLGKVINKYK